MNIEIEHMVYEHKNDNARTDVDGGWERHEEETRYNLIINLQMFISDECRYHQLLGGDIIRKMVVLNHWSLWKTTKL